MREVVTEGGVVAFVGKGIMLVVDGIDPEMVIVVGI